LVKMGWRRARQLAQPAHPAEHTRDGSPRVWDAGRWLKSQTTATIQHGMNAATLVRADRRTSGPATSGVRCS
jgi:hypothetical protein